MRKGLWVGGVVAVLLAGTTVNAWAGAIITSGPVTLGIATTGNLGDEGTETGLVLAGVGDAIKPGCFCEGWGVSGNGTSSGFADISVDGVNNLTVDSFVSSPTTATSMVHLTSFPDLQVTQAYAPSAGAPTALFQDVVTIHNSSSTDTITDTRYRRVMDWDIPPTEFDEFVTIQGLPATNLLFTNDNGFATANPLGSRGADLGGCGTNVNFTDCGPTDHGSLFDFGFGSLAPGDSKTFTIFYGAAYNEADALTALGNVGAEVYALGESNTVNGPTLGTPGTYIFGFKGVGGTPITPGPAPVVPEPSSLWLLGTGLTGLASSRRVRKVLSRT